MKISPPVRELACKPMSGTQRGRMTLITIETELRNQRGEPTTRQRDLAIEPGSASRTSRTKPNCGSGPVTRTQMVRFAGAGGDFNPIHRDEEFARAAGQPTVFAMGQLHAALLGRLAADW